MTMLMLTPPNGIRCVFLVILGLSKSLAQWGQNWQQPQPPKSGMNPSTMWGQQQSTGSNNANQQFLPPAQSGWKQYNPLPPPGWNNAPPRRPQQAGQLTGSPSNGTSTPLSSGGSPAETNGNSPLNTNLWIPPGSNQVPDPRNNQLQTPSQGQGDSSYQQGQPSQGQGGPPYQQGQPPQGQGGRPYQWPGVPGSPRRSPGGRYPASPGGTNSALVNIINKLTAAFTQFSLTLENIMTSLGKLTQLQ